MAREGFAGLPKHILMSADTVGGVWSYALELAKALARYGVRISLATMGAYATPAQRSELRPVTNVRLFESHYRLEWMKDPWDDVRAAGDWLMRLEETLRPDVIHMNSYVHAALPWTKPVLVVGHSCVQSWWRAVPGEDCGAAWTRYTKMVARGLRAAGLIVAPSRAMLSALHTYYGPIPAGTVIPNAADPAAFKVMPKEDIVLGAGRLWDKAKNLGVLDAVAPRLKWPVYIAGSPVEPRGTGVAHLSAAHALGELSRDEMKRWYGRASVFVAPALYEPFGMAALEAGLSGCALVLGDIASLREVWGDAALFVPPHDTEALARALQDLIRKSDWRAEMSLRARTRALEYTPQRMAAAYLEAYGRIADRDRRRHDAVPAAAEGKCL